MSTKSAVRTFCCYCSVRGLSTLGSVVGVVVCSAEKAYTSTLNKRDDT